MPPPPGNPSAPLCHSPLGALEELGEEGTPVTAEVPVTQQALEKVLGEKVGPGGCPLSPRRLTPRRA